MNKRDWHGRALVWLAQIGVCVVLLVCTFQAQAGVMTRETMAQAFPAPLVVGEKERDVPVWPIYAQDLTSTTVIAYAFEFLDEPFLF